jgi:hypothetical protein
VQLKLTPHPDFPCGAVEAITVEVARPAPSALRFAYRVSGRMAELVLPASAEPARADGLWRTTCFEAFLKPDGGETYLELNFAPSSDWAAYHFDAYRDGMAPLEIETPRIEARGGDHAFELDVTLDLARQLPPGPCRLAISAVIEETNGARSYWAIAHSPGRPDFHHDAGFAARVP